MCLAQFYLWYYIIRDRHSCPSCHQLLSFRRRTIKNGPDTTISDTDYKSNHLCSPSRVEDTITHHYSDKWGFHLSIITVWIFFSFFLCVDILDEYSECKSCGQSYVCRHCEIKKVSHTTISDSDDKPNQPYSPKTVEDIITPFFNAR